MKRLNLCGGGLLGLALAVGCVQAAPLSPEVATEQAFEMAQDLYQECKWDAAYQEWARLADQGHLEAAQIVLFMWRYGPRLFGRGWNVPAARLNAWINQLELAESDNVRSKVSGL